MPSQIKIYTELHWGVQRPCLIFRINSQVYHAHCEIIDHENHVEKAVFTLHVDLESENILEVELNDKSDDLITADSDHWVDVKNIMIDGVPADSMIETSEFFHSMSDEWVVQMRQQGIDIQSIYQPGTSLRINGVCRWRFREPFTIEKLLDLWQLH